MASSGAISPIRPKASAISVAAGITSSPNIPDNCAILAPALRDCSAVKPTSAPIPIISPASLVLTSSPTLRNFSNSRVAFSISMLRGTVASTTIVICSAKATAASSIPPRPAMKKELRIVICDEASSSILAAWKLPTTLKNIRGAPIRAIL